MIRQRDDETLQLAIPKGRMYDGIVRLLAEAGVPILGTCAGMILLANHIGDGEILKEAITLARPDKAG